MHLRVARARARVNSRGELQRRKSRAMAKANRWRCTFGARRGGD